MQSDEALQMLLCCLEGLGRKPAVMRCPYDGGSRPIEWQYLLEQGLVVVTKADKKEAHRWNSVLEYPGTPEIFVLERRREVLHWALGWYTTLTFDRPWV